MYKVIEENSILLKACFYGTFVQNGISFALSLFVIIIILDLDPTPAGKCQSSFTENSNFVPQNI